MLRKNMLAAVAASALISSAALAAVSFDANTGSGFVGKGDIQLLYGWNDQALQRNASGVTFSYNADEHYSYDCTFTVEVGRDRVREPRTQTRGTSTTVNSSVAYDTRKNNQGKITGFNLNGFGTTTATGAAPVDGGSCPGGPFNDGTISNVVLTSSTGGLSVTWSGTTYPLPNTPVI